MLTRLHADYRLMFERTVLGTRGQRLRDIIFFVIISRCHRNSQALVWTRPSFRHQLPPPRTQTMNQVCSWILIAWYWLWWCDSIIVLVLIVVIKVRISRHLLSGFHWASFIPGLTYYKYIWPSHYNPKPLMLRQFNDLSEIPVLISSTNFTQVSMDMRSHARKSRDMTIERWRQLLHRVRVCKQCLDCATCVGVHERDVSSAAVLSPLTTVTAYPPSSSSSSSAAAAAAAAAAAVSSSSSKKLSVACKFYERK